MKAPSRRDLAALAVLVAHGVLLFLAPPILDYLQTQPKRAWGPFEALHELDAVTRAPVADLAQPVESVLGVRQNWHFYATGASKTRHFEIHVDGELWHRSNDPEHAFLAGPLANSRLRHHVKDWVRGKHLDINEDALLRWVVAEVQQAKPDARVVEIRGLEGRWPGELQRIARARRAQAPDWQPMQGAP